MARRSTGPRTFGPYEHGRRWRVILVDERGGRTAASYETEEKARQVLRSLRRKLAAECSPSIGGAIDRYEVHLRTYKENKVRSVDTTVSRLEWFFPNRAMRLGELTATQCDERYAALVARLATDSHRNALAELKTFLRWCVSKGMIAKSPAEGVEPQGKRRRGKKQLRIEEARRWTGRALELAAGGEGGAVAALMTLLMGLRASEVVERDVRDLDDGGRLLWIPSSKTEAGRRTLEVPALLRSHLLRLAAGRGAEERLFGHRERDWPRAWVQRICAQVGVPKVTAHGMRGLHATLAEEHGVTAHAVAAALGHESVTTTHAHYTARSATDNARQRRAIEVLEGAADGTARIGN